jgi:hypothetical protein
MKKHLKGYIAGVLSAMVILTTVNVYAGNAIDVVLNNINIAVNGTKVASKGEDYTLSNGSKVPYSIVYKGTTYLPMRKVAELAGKDVSWDNKTKTASINDKKAVTTPVTNVNDSVPVKKEVKVDNGKNSRTNPASIGTKLVLDNEGILEGKFQTELTLTEVVRGDKAWEICKNENRFNDAPEDGKEYMLAKFKVKVLKTENDAKIDINNACFEAVSKDGAVYSDLVFLTIPNSISTELYQGSEYEGYTYFQIKKGDAPLIRFRKAYNSYAWFNANK